MLMGLGGSHIKQFQDYCVDLAKDADSIDGLQGTDPGFSSDMKANGFQQDLFIGLGNYDRSDFLCCKVSIVESYKTDSGNPYNRVNEMTIHSGSNIGL